jgi:hypothetical protein
LRVAAVGFDLPLGGHRNSSGGLDRQGCLSYFEHIQRDLGNRSGISISGWKMRGEDF